MEYKDGMDKYKMFESLHRAQLESSGVPDMFWQPLYKKLENNIFDAGETFSIFKIDYDEGRRPEDPVYTVLVTKEAGISCSDPSQIYLVDHAWTYESSRAVEYLTNVPGLVERMCNLMGLDIDNDSSANIENICREMWRYNQTYTPGFGTAEERTPVWYIMDELGSAIEHSDTPTFRLVPFFHVNDQITYSLLFPIEDVKPMEKVTRDYLEGPMARDATSRKILMLPWSSSRVPDPSVDITTREPDDEYYLSDRIRDELPSESAPCRPTRDASRALKVYSEYDVVNRCLRRSGFEIVDTREEADILWLTSHFTGYKCLSEDSPDRYINQFPYESLLTMKNFLSVVARRQVTQGRDRYEDNPPWYPTTYDLNSELEKFANCFLSREQQGLSNYWICKPWNLARGLDMTVTDNLNCILRLPASGPKLAQRYLASPVLFDRENVGLVKFDVRYVLLLVSVHPLRVYAYRNFFLRFANKPFDLTDFWDREKHFTVMNYDPRTPLYKMLAADFVREFDRQNSGTTDWATVESDIFKCLKEVFVAGTCRPPPYGLGRSPQSRALYAVDLMLSRETSDSVQPKILEVNWMPDCARACEYYPSFFDDVFSLLFRDEVDESLFQLL